MMFYATQVLFHQVDPCGMMASSRIWYNEYTCDFNETVDPNNVYDHETIDLPVINVNHLISAITLSYCAYKAADL